MVESAVAAGLAAAGLAGLVNSQTRTAVDDRGEEEHHKDEGTEQDDAENHILPPTGEPTTTLDPPPSSFPQQESQSHPPSPLLSNPPTFSSALHQSSHLPTSSVPSIPPTSSQQPSSSSSIPAHIPTFKEILALPSAPQRIHAFESTRSALASMDTGLSDWLRHMKAMPEHSGDDVSWGAQAPVGAVASSTRAKLSKALPGVLGASGAGAGSGLGGGKEVSQPYYQQYLNASSSSASPASSSLTNSAAGARQASGSGTGGGYPSQGRQDLTPGASSGNGGYGGMGGTGTGSGGSKGQVQAKSKELLHTAGVFGGKASKAGKGLFAMGKSRFRGGGAGDKVD